MKRILPLLFAFVLAAPSARATTLVYEGFSSSDYTATSDYTASSLNGKKSGIDSIGLDKVNGWNSGTGVFVAQPNGLPLPDIWKDGTVHGTKDLRAVLYNTTATSTTRDNRAQQRALTCEWPTSGSIYFRFLMQVPKAALSTSYLGNWNYWIAGLGTEAIEKPTTGDQCNIANGIYMGVRNRNGTLEVAAYVKNPADGATFTKPLFTIDTSKTLRCACIAKIDIGENGNDTLSFYAAPTNTLTTDFEWTFTTNGIALVSGSAKPSYLQMLGHYKVNSQYITFDEFLVTTDQAEAYAHVAPTSPVLGDVSMARTGATTYALEAVEAANAADLSWIADDGAAVWTNGTTSVSEGATNTWTVSGLAADKTYAISVLAENASGSSEKAAGTIYTGELALGATTDANENGLVAGGVTVSRAAADPFPLTVNYTISGSAGSQGTTWAAPEPVVIPANATNAVLPVVPIIDASVTQDVTITVTLAAGNYEIPAAASATLTLANLVAPVGYNTWIATADGLASVGSNWSEGHAPTAGENVLLDGRFSTKNCEWDAAASATVASWTQASDYTGTVTFDTEFPDYAGATFTLFTIFGDCDILGGKWSCRGNYNNFGTTVDPMNTTATAKRWCLNVSVGGDLEIASGASVTVTGRGYGYPSSNTGVPAYGGYAYGGATSPYGSITEPFDPGKGALAQGDQKRKASAIGGGAVKLAVAGDLIVDGSIVALGTADQNIARSGGSGGSIWIAANQISGSGTIDASAPTGIGNDQIVAVGSGGRIALYTQSPLAFPMANVSCNGTGYRGTSWSWNSRVSGPGTIYMKDPTQSHGTLYVKQSTAVSTQNTKWTGTPVMGDLALDAVVLSGRTSLRIPEGASLTLPSLAAVTTDNTEAGQAGLVYAGGTLNIGAGDQTLKANVAFSSPTAFAFPGDLTLETGAKLGSLNSMYGTAANDYDQTFTVSVAGDLTIPAGASAGATRCCALTASGKARYTASHGGQSLYLAAEARTNGFDSVLRPSMPGGSANINFPAGGAFTLTVGGTLTLDGPMTADGGGARGSDSTYDGTSAGAGGTLTVTAGALAGVGTMSAAGGCGRWNYAGGAGGGRIAVRLTNAGASFSDRWTTNITAYGESFGGGNGKASSAGTVYLQTAKDGEARGLVVVRNDLAIQAAAANNNATTRFPGNGDGCDAPAALKRTSLRVAGASRVALTDSLRSANLDMDAGTTLDLAGHEFRVTAAHIGGENVEPGTYTAAQLQGRGFDEVIDTADGAGGTLRVLGAGTILIVR